MPPFPEYARYDALGLAELIRKREVSAEEVLEAAIARAEQLDPQLNAIVDRLYDRARARIAAGLPAGPLSGVPFLLKDNIALADTRLTYGSAIMRDYVSPETHELVQRYERAGLVIFGRTSTSELGLLPLTEATLFGPTHNPWARGRSAGGSSGGAAAAVAAGIVPAAHANDGGGSIRIPASCCGVFGLKPSRGRMPGTPQEEPEGILSEHALCRSVRDSAALLDATWGPQPGARFWAPPPPRPFAAAAAEDPPPLRIAFTTADFTGRAAHPECAAATRAAAALCAELGHAVTEEAPPVDGDAFNEAFTLIWATIPGYVFKIVERELSRSRAARAAMRVLGKRPVFEALTRVATRRLGSPFELFTRRLARLQAAHTPADVWLCWNTLQEASYAIGGFLQRYDLLLTPVLGEPPWPLDNFAHDAPLDALREQLFAYSGYTAICNTSGLPAMSVPLHWTPQGLPVGVQFIGAFAAEATLLALAGQLERARPWAARRPPLARDAAA